MAVLGVDVNKEVEWQVMESERAEAKAVARWHDLVKQYAGLEVISVLEEREGRTGERAETSIPAPGSEENDRDEKDGGSGDAPDLARAGQSGPEIDESLDTFLATGITTGTGAIVSFLAMRWTGPQSPLHAFQRIILLHGSATRRRSGTRTQIRHRICRQGTPRVFFNGMAGHHVIVDTFVFVCTQADYRDFFLS